jgi:hypothetical protein
MSGNPEVSANNKRLAKYVAGLFGGNPSAARIADAAEESVVDIVAALDSPLRGLISYSTFGLSDHPNRGGPKGRAMPVEIVGAAGTEFKAFDKAIATAAFCVINSKWPCFAGAIFPDCLVTYRLSKSMKHFFFVTPCLWTEDLKPLRLGKKKVTWLMAVPISDEERRLAEKDGPARLDKLFEQKKIDIPNLDRASVV